MYICVCKQISDKEVQDLLNKHPHLELNEILKRLGLGSDCGVCVEDFISQRQNLARTAKSTKVPSRYTLPSK